MKTIDNSPINNSTINTNEENESEIVTTTSTKKRGRRPKGGKIITQPNNISKEVEIKPNVILHLKCFLHEIQNIYNENDIKSFNFNTNELSYEVIEKPKVNISNEESSLSSSPSSDNPNKKELQKKLKLLEHKFHNNNISDKKSACFWCTYDFLTQPIFIPKFIIKNSYNVYGCFCSPECAVAYLMQENIDSTTKFERYYLLNHIYSPVYNYNKNIKPAPNPHYMLEKFYGNLTINEYRDLFKCDRLFVMIDKPLTRILPEFHEDNDDYIINNKIIPSNNYSIKRTSVSSTEQVKNHVLKSFYSDKK
jgi:hypothetical protein